MVVWILNYHLNTVHLNTGPVKVSYSDPLCYKTFQIADKYMFGIKIFGPPFELITFQMFQMYRKVPAIWMVIWIPQCHNRWQYKGAQTKWQCNRSPTSNHNLPNQIIAKRIIHSSSQQKLYRSRLEELPSKTRLVRYWAMPWCKEASKC